jgi:Spy/CpxP family protein refolding chaperone
MEQNSESGRMPDLLLIDLHLHKEKSMQASWQSRLLMVMVAVGMCTLARAQGPGTAPPPAPNAPPHRSIEALSELRWLTQQLSLTPEQREKLRPIVVEEGEQLHDLRINERLSPEQKRARTTEIREAFRPKIAAELTPEQQEKWKKMQAAPDAKKTEGTKDTAPAGTPPK